MTERIRKAHCCINHLTDVNMLFLTGCICYAWDWNWGSGSNETTVVGVTEPNDAKTEGSGSVITEEPAPDATSTTTPFYTSSTSVGPDIDLIAATTKDCVFPFTYAEVEYAQCTDVDSITGRPWCATAANYSNDEWRFCSE